MAIWIGANVKGEVDALRTASRTFADKLVTFEVKFLDVRLGAVVTFGNNTRCTLSGGVGVEELKDFPGYSKDPALTIQFDVLIHILSLCHDVNFPVARAAMGTLGDYIEARGGIHDFRWVEERGLSGFVDGTENLAGEKTRREVVVTKDDADTGGGYVFVQRWEHNPRQLNRMSVYDQEMMIGCAKEANEEINSSKRPETSHLTRVDLKENGKGPEIVYQNLPYDVASGTHGLYFCTYYARLYNIEQQLLSMSGDIDGKRDMMPRFIKPVTGGYYFASSLDKLMALQASPTR